MFTPPKLEKMKDTVYNINGYLIRFVISDIALLTNLFICGFISVISISKSNLIFMDIFVFINITAFYYAEFNRVNFISLTRVFCVSFLFSLHLHYKHMHAYVNKKLIIFFCAHFFKKLLSL